MHGIPDTFDLTGNIRAKITVLAFFGKGKGGNCKQT